MSCRWGTALEVPQREEGPPIDPSVCLSEVSCVLGPGLGHPQPGLCSRGFSLVGRTIPILSVRQPRLRDVSEDLQAPRVVGSNKTHWWGGGRRKKVSPVLRTLFRGKILPCGGRWGRGPASPSPTSSGAGGWALGRGSPRSGPAAPALQLCPEGTHGGRVSTETFRRLPALRRRRELRGAHLLTSGVLISVGGTPTADLPTACRPPGAPAPSSLWPQPMARDTDSGLDVCLGVSRLLKSLVPLSAF